MADLVEYSDKFDHKFSYDRFSKETLLKLLEAYSEYMRRIDGLWYLAVLDKWGNDEAFDCDLRVWEKYQPYETKSMSSLLNIRDDDVAAIMKYIQLTPSTWFRDYDLDLKSPNYGVMTVNHCPNLLSLEKEGTGREKLICQEVELKVLGSVVRHFNPNIKITGLKLPPRTDYSDCCCQWEYKLER